MNNENDKSTGPRINWANIPFAPSKCPFFYGWVIVAAATVSIVSSLPGQTMGITVFTDFLIDDLGITSRDLSLAYLCGTLASGMMLPYAGKLLDRFGVRIIAISASLGLAVGMVLIANCGIIAKSLNELFPSTWSSIIVISVMFMIVRFFGQGNLTMVGRVAMGKWFNHRRGIATAISGLVVTYGFSSSPSIINGIIDKLGWQNTCLVLAVAVGGGMSFFAWIFLRDNPEQCGLVMDGVTDPAWHKKQADRSPDIYREFTRSEALRTVSFWAMALGLACHGMVITAAIFHFSPLSSEMGYERSEAFKTFLFTPFFGIPARFIISFLVDYTGLRLKWILLAMMVTEFTGIIGMSIFGTSTGWWMFVVGFGLTNGFWGVLCNVSFPRYFGRKHLGSIQGLNMSIMVIASAVGPWLFSFGKSELGYFYNVGFVCLVLPIGVFVLSLFAYNPQHRLRPVGKGSCSE